MYKNFYFKFLLSYLFLIDSLLGILLNFNSLTYLMTLLISILLPITLLTTNSKILGEFLFIISIILYITFSTYNLLI